MSFAAAMVVAPAAGAVWPWLVAVLATAAALLLPRLWSARARAQRRWQRVHAELATRNGLTAAEARLLWRLGTSAGLDNPALVFVRPSLFESRAAMVDADPELVQSIRGKVYGG